MAEVNRYTLEQITGAMGEALRGLDADAAEFPRLWRLFIEATVDKLKALPVEDPPPSIYHSNWPTVAESGIVNAATVTLSAPRQPMKSDV